MLNLPILWDLDESVVLGIMVACSLVIAGLALFAGSALARAVSSHWFKD